MKILASKEDIIEKIKEKNTEWFANSEYFYGEHEEGKHLNLKTNQLYTQVEFWALKNDEDIGSCEYQRSPDDILDDSTEIVEERNLGDGNECFKTIWFKTYDVYVTLSGVYSSWDAIRWSYVCRSEPFAYHETRFKEYIEPPIK